MEAVRSATDADLARVVELARQARAEVRTQRGGAVFTAQALHREPLEPAFAGLLTNDRAALLVGTLEGVVFGYAAMHVEVLSDDSLLAVADELYVEPAARAVGVGEVLAAGLVDLAQQFGCRGIDAFALPGDRATKNFFETQGFTARVITMHTELA